MSIPARKATYADKTVESYRLGGGLESGRWLLLDTHGDASSARIEPFAAVELSLDLLFEG